MTEKNYKAPAASRALKILELMARNGVSSGASELAEELDITVNSAYRILCELENIGYVYRNSSQKFALTPRLYYIGRMAKPVDDKRIFVDELLKKLSEHTKETVLLCSLTEQNDVLLEEQYESPLALKFVSKVGCTYPSYSSAMGKAMLSCLEPSQIENYAKNAEFEKFTDNTISDREMLKEQLGVIKTNGYSIDDEESADGIYCISAVILGDENQPFMAVGVSGPKSRMLKNVEDKIKMVQDSAKQISRMYGAK